MGGKDTRGMTDGELLRSHLAGDAKAFAELVRRYADLAHAAACRQLPAEADDVTQAVFLLLERKASTLLGRASIATWVFTATRLCARTATRAAQRRRRHEREAAAMRSERTDMPGASSLTRDGDRDELTSMLDDAIESLPRVDRQIVILRHLQRQPVEDIAAAVGLSSAAATKRAQRAVDRLRDWFTRHGVTVPTPAVVGVLAQQAAHHAPAGLAGAPASLAAAKLAAATPAPHVASATLPVAAVVAALSLTIGIVVATRSSAPPPMAATGSPATQPATTAPVPPAVSTLPTSARLTLRETKSGKLVQQGTFYFRSPASVRVETTTTETATGIATSQPVEVERDGTHVHAVASTKLFVIEPVFGGGMTAQSKLLLPLAAQRVTGATTQPAIPLDMPGAPPGAMVQLEPRDQQPYAGRTFRAFEAVGVMPGSPSMPLLGPGSKLLLLCDEAGVCRAMTMDRGADDHSEMDVELDVPLDDALFALVGPPGYTDVRDGIFPRLDPELRLIADRYYRSRETLHHYRLAVFPQNDRYPRYRNFRDGDRWRLDSTSLLAMMKNDSRYEVTDVLGADPAELLDRVGGADVPMEEVVMTYHDQLAQVGFNYATNDGGARVRAQWLVPPILTQIGSDAANQAEEDRRLRTRWYKQAPRFQAGMVAPYDLRQLGWPAWKGDELIAPHGWDLGTPPPLYCHLADRADRPGLIGVRAVQGNQMFDYWIDPAKDDLCVRYTEYWDNDEPWKTGARGFDPDAYYAKPRPVKPGPEPSHSSQVITRFGRTTDGHWYPLAFEGGTRLVLDTEGAIDPTLFVWPAGAPQPGSGQAKPTIVMVGTPAAAEMDSRQKSKEHLDHIGDACGRYVRDHQGAWPNDLDQLVKANYLAADDLNNPRNPDAKPGYNYRRPSKPGRNANMIRIIAWENFGVRWPATSPVESLKPGVQAVLGSGDVQLIERASELNRQLPLEQ
jgi:RNA polymerase sigma factor (sigma-70 family)